MSRIDDLVERGFVPDALLRAAIRRLLRARLREICSGDPEADRRRRDRLIAQMRVDAVAPHGETASRQHYEVPAAFFRRVLGRRLKYSCAYWPQGVTSIDAAEEASLELTCERARLADGMEILELGCGWGALCLWMAERFPASHILAVSNSHGQRRAIEAERRDCGLDNLELVTADINDFATRRRFDRVVSVEMFEHLRNWGELLARIRSWLLPDGRLFVHHFCHRRWPYLFEDRGPGDWMSRHFFTGGLMPSADIFKHFEDSLVTERQWSLNGTHYQKTARAWLARLDRHRHDCRRILAEVHGPAAAGRWLERWRVFFLACAELFGFRQGSEWLVSHSRLAPRDTITRL